MVRAAPCEAHSARYDAWYSHHPAAYQYELLAVRALLPNTGLGLEVGVGSGRFAAPLGVSVGLDAAPAMLSLAARRNIIVIRGTDETLPFLDDTFDFVLMVTVMCFLDSAAQGLQEIRRVVRPGEALVIGFLDKGSPSGLDHLARCAHNVFFADATFFANADIRSLLHEAGFSELRWVQTLFCRPDEMTEIDAPRPGYGQGAFVVVQATWSGARRL